MLRSRKSRSERELHLGKPHRDVDDRNAMMLGPERESRVGALLIVVVEPDLLRPPRQIDQAFQSGADVGDPECQRRAKRPARADVDDQPDENPLRSRTAWFTAHA